MIFDCPSTDPDKVTAGQIGYICWLKSPENQTSKIDKECSLLANNWKMKLFIRAEEKVFYAITNNLGMPVFGNMFRVSQGIAVWSAFNPSSKNIQNQMGYLEDMVLTNIILQSNSRNGIRTTDSQNCQKSIQKTIHNLSCKRMKNLSFSEDCLISDLQQKGEQKPMGKTKPVIKIPNTLHIVQTVTSKSSPPGQVGSFIEKNGSNTSFFESKMFFNFKPPKIGSGQSQLVSDKQRRLIKIAKLSLDNSNRGNKLTKSDSQASLSNGRPLLTSSKEDIFRVNKIYTNDMHNLSKTNCI